jgi:hypothetical protein
MLRLLWQIDRLRRRVQREQQSRTYSDLAIAPAGSGELELYQTSDTARQAAARADRRAETRRRLAAAG